MLVHLVADYGHGDLAFAEVCQRLALHLPAATLLTTPVPAFDTVSAGFCVAQLALTEGPAERIVFHNVAPRADEEDPRPGNEGERLVIARLANEVMVIGPNAGHCFAFVRDEAVRMHEVVVSQTGSQFRSRDFFPALLARIVQGDQTVLGDAVAPSSVPDLLDRRVVYVDGYGNLKTTCSAPPDTGSTVDVRIGEVTATAHVTDGTFEVPPGELAFAPGSSGWPLSTGGHREFYELFLRGASAAARFGHPRAGARMELTPRSTADRTGHG